MAAPISNPGPDADDERLIRALRAEGLSITEIAKKWERSRETIHRWLRIWELSDDLDKAQKAAERHRPRLGRLA